MEEGGGMTVAAVRLLVVFIGDCRSRMMSAAVTPIIANIEAAIQRVFLVFFIVLFVYEIQHTYYTIKVPKK